MRVGDLIEHLERMDPDVDVALGLDGVLRPVRAVEEIQTFIEIHTFMAIVVDGKPEPLRLVVIR